MVWFLPVLGAAVGGFVGSAAVCALIEVIVEGIITKRKAQEKARQQEDMKDAFVEMVNKNTNEVKLKDMKSGKSFTMRGDGIADEVRVGMKLFS